MPCNPHGDLAKRLSTIREMILKVHDQMVILARFNHLEEYITVEYFIIFIQDCVALKIILLVMSKT